MSESRRRSLTNVGGEVDMSGEPEAARALADAVDVAPTSEADAPDRAHVHGFHAYPARTHPVTARRLVAAFCPDNGTVLDPFCGSGTVVVEAMLEGRAAIGTDLNPFAVMLARSKTYPRSREKIAALLAASRDVAAFADARRKAKAGAFKRLPAEDLQLFDVHVVLELDSLRGGIQQKAPPETRPDLMLVLSSILVKLSKKKGDTSEEHGAAKRIGAGYPTKLFVKKTEELGRRFEEFAELLPKPAPRSRVFLDDATQLAKVEDASIDAVISSPPYVATYDYLAHHELRMRWLGLDERPLDKGELGAKRNYAKLTPREARTSWERELDRLLRALGRVTRKGGNVVLLIADSATPRGPRGEPPEALRADQLVADAAERGRLLEPVARASQARPHFHAPTQDAFRDQARAEHALLLRRT